MNSRTFRIVIVTLIGICLYRGLNAENLVKNPGFENGMGNWLVWPSNIVLFEIDKSVFRSGSASLKIAPAAPTDDGCLYQYIPMKEGKTYEIKFWLKTVDYKASPGGGISFKFAFNREGGGNASAGTQVKNFSDIPTVGEWKEFTFTVTPAEGTALCQFILVASKMSGTVWIDDLSVEQVLKDVPISKIVSPAAFDEAFITKMREQAYPLESFCNMTNPNVPIKASTRAFLSYDSDNFYIIFENTEPLMGQVESKIQQRDGEVWSDECNEVFIASPNGTSRQFIVSIGNVQWDGELYQQGPKKPYKVRPEWNGTWESIVIKDSNCWTAAFKIPFSNFGQVPAAGQIWRINLARERHIGGGEISHWNQVQGTFNNIEKFALLSFVNDDTAILTRYIDREPSPFLVERASPSYLTLLTEQPGGYLVDSYHHGFFLTSYSKNRQAHYTPEKWEREQANIFQEWGQAGMWGPPFPWILAAWSDVGKEKIEFYYSKYGMRFNFFMYQILSIARRSTPAPN